MIFGIFDFFQKAQKWKLGQFLKYTIRNTLIVLIFARINFRAPWAREKNLFSRVFIFAHLPFTLFSRVLIIAHPKLKTLNLALKTKNK